MKKSLLIATAFAFFTGTASAAQVPIDLSTWSANNANGNWVVAADGNSVRQTINGDPTAFLNGINQTSYTIEGTFNVTDRGDDDFIGFVFGYQNTNQFYLFDWKQQAQLWGGLNTQEGFRILKVDSDTNIPNIDFWSANSSAFTLLDSHTGTNTGWRPNTEYSFFLDYFTTPGEFAVTIKQGDVTLWDVIVADSTFASGQFGFYNYSQALVNYAGFTQELVPPSEVPLPAAVWMFAPALMGFLGLRRRMKKA